MTHGRTITSDTIQDILVYALNVRQLVLGTASQVVLMTCCLFKISWAGFIADNSTQHITVQVTTVEDNVATKY